MIYIAIWEYERTDTNPYYHPSISNIEPETITTTKTEYRICHSAEDMRSVLTVYPKAKFYILGNEVKIKVNTSLKIEEL